MNPLEQLRDALRTTGAPREPGFLTRQEFQLALGIGSGYANKLLLKMKLAGRLEVRSGRVPLYRSDLPGWPSGDGSAKPPEQPRGRAPRLRRGAVRERQVRDPALLNPPLRTGRQRGHR